MQALLRKAEALIGLNHTDRARKLVAQVEAEAPEFMGKKTLEKLKKKIARQDKLSHEKQKKKFAGMFSKKPKAKKNQTTTPAADADASADASADTKASSTSTSTSASTDADADAAPTR